MARKSKDDIRFEIDQLRKDKIIYKVESAALSLIALVIYFYIPVVFRDVITDPKYQQAVKLWFSIILIIAVVFWMYTAIGNISRVKKIKELENKL